MSREIKFRAWGGYIKQMWAVREIDFIHHECSVLYGEDDVEPSNVYFEHIKLMQFTGLRDKHGKEIYEGDIILSHKKNVRLVSGKMGDVTEKGVVEWNHDGWFMKYLPPFDWDPMEPAVGLWTPDGELEVIGNLYENKEMLPSSD